MAIVDKARRGARGAAGRRSRRKLCAEMSTQAPEPRAGESLELPVEELLRRARPLPPHDEMVIDDLTEEEGRAFLAALQA